MDPIALATAVVTALLPYFKKGAESVAGEVGKQALTAGEGLFKALKERWHGKPDAQQKLDALRQDPDLPQEPLISALIGELESDKAFADAIAGLMNKAGPEVKIEVHVGKAEKLIGPTVGRIKSGRLSAKITGDECGIVTAGKYGDIG